MIKSLLLLLLLEIPLGEDPANPGHSCKHVLESGSSEGDGEYWIDPENSGNPLKVYCDMTADGGKLTLYAVYHRLPSHTCKGTKLQGPPSCQSCCACRLWLCSKDRCFQLFLHYL